MWRHYSAIALVFVGLVIALIATTWMDEPEPQTREKATPIRTWSPSPTWSPPPTWTPVPGRRIYVSPTPRPTRVPTRVRYTPVPTSTPTAKEREAFNTLVEMLEGCGGLSEYDQKKVYWSIVVAQDEAEEQARSQGRSTVDYALADLAVMTYFSITARTLECIKDKGTEKMWPIPSQ